MTYSEKINLEAKHCFEDWNKIYLFKEGSFLRAYNQSAWFITNFIYTDEIAKTLGKKRGLKIIKTTKKFTDLFIFVGFPFNSLDKYLGNLIFEEYAPNIFRAEINPNDFEKRFIDHETLMMDYEDFFDSIAVSKNIENTDFPKSETKSQNGIKNIDIFDIMKEICQYDTSDKNINEVKSFIANVKKSIQSILFKN